MDNQLLRKTFHQQRWNKKNLLIMQKKKKKTVTQDASKRLHI